MLKSLSMPVLLLSNENEDNNENFYSIKKQSLIKQIFSLLNHLKSY